MHANSEVRRPLSARVLCVGLLLLSACGPARWTMPNATSADLHRDMFECEGESESTLLRKNQFAAMAQEDSFRECMRMKGWTETQ